MSYSGLVRVSSETIIALFFSCDFYIGLIISTIAICSIFFAFLTKITVPLISIFSRKTGRREEGLQALKRFPVMITITTNPFYG